MRIASYYGDIRTVGRNDGGPLYHTTCLRRIFGPENVLHVFPGKEAAEMGKIDLHYWVDWGEDAFGWTDFICPKPNVYVVSDTHLGYEYRLKKAREFDWVFCNQRKAVDDFVRDGIPPDRCFWLPHAFDPLAYTPGVFNTATNSWMRDAESVKRFDVCFVGNLNDANRVAHLDRLFKAFPNFHWGTERFHEAAEKFSQSKIVFNVSARKELNMRCFEALGAGAFLLTDRIPASEQVFIEGAHFAAYGNMDEMVERASYYLANDGERALIAACGHAEAAAKHTYLDRVMTVLDTIGAPYAREQALRLKLPDLQPQAIGA